jgi:hypothetical protein
MAESDARFAAPNLPGKRFVEQPHLRGELDKHGIMRYLYPRNQGYSGCPTTYGHAGETYSTQAELTIDGTVSSGVLAKSNELRMVFPDQ